MKGSVVDSGGDIMKDSRGDIMKGQQWIVGGHNEGVSSG